MTIETQHSKTFIRTQILGFLTDTCKLNVERKIQELLVGPCRCRVLAATHCASEPVSLPLLATDDIASMSANQIEDVVELHVRKIEHHIICKERGNLY